MNEKNMSFSKDILLKKIKLNILLNIDITIHIKQYSVYDITTIL